MRADTVNEIVGIRYVKYRNLSQGWWGTELTIKEMVLDKNKDTFPHRHPEREDDYEKRIRRVKKCIKTEASHSF